jgi:hypothetical protein
MGLESYDLCARHQVGRLYAQDTAGERLRRICGWQLSSHLDIREVRRGVSIEMKMK